MIDILSNQNLFSKMIPERQAMRLNRVFSFVKISDESDEIHSISPPLIRRNLQY